MSGRERKDFVNFSVKGQIVVPNWLRKELEIAVGTRAVVCRQGDGILLKPITAKHYRAMRGSLKGQGVLKALKAERNREREL